MPAQPPDAPAEAIRELERSRFRAMVDGDGEVLDKLLADNASYVHTNGKRESKRQFIDAITAGRRRYRQIEIETQDLMPGGRDTWIVHGRALIEMESKNGALLFRSLTRRFIFTSMANTNCSRCRRPAWRWISAVDARRVGHLKTRSEGQRLVSADRGAGPQESPVLPLAKIC